MITPDILLQQDNTLNAKLLILRVGVSVGVGVGDGVGQGITKSQYSL
jgi:hypothetical protein